MLQEIELQDNPLADDGGGAASLLSGAGASSSSGLVGVARGGSGLPLRVGTMRAPRRGGGIFAALAAEPLLLQTMAGVVLGVLVGSVARYADPSPRAVELLGLPG